MLQEPGRYSGLSGLVTVVVVVVMAAMVVVLELGRTALPAPRPGAAADGQDTAWGFCSPSLRAGSGSILSNHLTWAMEHMQD